MDALLLTTFVKVIDTPKTSNLIPAQGYLEGNL